MQESQMLHVRHTRGMMQIHIPSYTITGLCYSYSTVVRIILLHVAMDNTITTHALVTVTGSPAVRSPGHRQCLDGHML